jgi:hypothetical protein
MNMVSLASSEIQIKNYAEFFFHCANSNREREIGGDSFQKSEKRLKIPAREHTSFKSILIMKIYIFSAV